MKLYFKVFFDPMEQSIMVSCGLHYGLLFFFVSIAAHFNPVHQVLVLATDQLAVLKLVSSSGLGKSGVWSHAHPISGLRYSKCFNQIVTACEGSVSAIWCLKSEIMQAHFYHDTRQQECYYSYYDLMLCV